MCICGSECTVNALSLNNRTYTTVAEQKKRNLLVMFGRPGINVTNLAGDVVLLDAGRQAVAWGGPAENVCF